MKYITQKLKGDRPSKKQITIFQNIRTQAQTQTRTRTLGILRESPIYFKKCLNNYQDIRCGLNWIGGSRIRTRTLRPNSEVKFGFGACLYSSNFALKYLPMMKNINEQLLPLAQSKDKSGLKFTFCLDQKKKDDFFMYHSSSNNPNISLFSR
jgi:hypothetical protein